MAEPLRSRLWTLPVRLGLASMWVIHGLEKFGLKWPALLGGGTHSVRDMLDLMAEVTPFAPVRALIAGALLPLADLAQYPVGILEIALGLAILAGLGLRWAVPMGAAIQTLFWLGFFGLDWPFQYPLIILAHIAIMDRGPTEACLPMLRLMLGTIWLYQSGGDNPWLLTFGGLVLAGLGARALSLAALPLIWVAQTVEGWGTWPWTYYMAALIHMALLLGRPAFGVAQMLPQRYRSWAA